MTSSTLKSSCPILAVLIVATVCCFGSAFVFADSGSVVRVPTPGTKVKTGLAVDVDTQWVDGNGYRPVRVTVKPLGGGPSAADRRLDVKITPHSWQWDMPMAGVSTSIELEQGQTAVEQTVLIPQNNPWGSIEIETLEDGRRCDDLCAKLGIGVRNNLVWSEAAPTIVLIDPDAPIGNAIARWAPIGRPAATGKKVKKPELLPDVRALATLFLTDENSAGLTANDFDLTDDIDDNDTLRVVNALSRMKLLRPEWIPTEWLALSAVDVVIVSLTDLHTIHQVPARRDALRTWLSTGTILCVYDVGDSFESVPELERLLKLSPYEAWTAGDPVADDSVDDLVERGWRVPTAADYGDQVAATRGVEWNNQWYVTPQPVNTRTQKKKPSSGLKPENLKPFLVRSVDHGHLVAMAGENPFPGKREQWCWLFNTVNNLDWMWYQRHGLSFHRDNPQYWNLLIPGVGDAPVNSFLVLISLFVIVIGPVNYFMLGQRRKLYLLLVTVPLGAGIVTAALFTYAIVNDGLGVRVRARSLTTIDQTNGRTISWSRQSYYAGLAPSSGMAFPTDAAVYPIEHRPAGRYGQPKNLGRMTRWSDEQRLAQGYLNSRSTGQLMVVESRDTKLGIKVNPSDADNATPRVTNQLGVDIEQLLICAADGSTLSCGKLPANESVQMHKVDGEEFETRWGKLFSLHRPQYPIGFDPNQVENAAAIFGNDYAWWQRVDRGLPEPSTQTSILERGVRAIGQLELKDMKPRSYIAIVATAPNVSLGIDGVKEEASFHIVRGSW